MLSPETEEARGCTEVCAHQIAFADLVVLNKTDLVDSESLDHLDARLAALDRWLGHLVRTEDVLRMKGVIAVPWDERRFVFQGVRRLVDVAPHTPWGEDPRVNRLVFIGRGLDEQRLRDALEACAV